MTEKIKHIGYPVPTEMWNNIDNKPKEDFKKHQAICDLLEWIGLAFHSLQINQLQQV